MTARTGNSATEGHVARAQPADPPRTAGRPPASGRSRDSGSPEASRTQFMERITVALIPKVAEGLQRLQSRTNMSKTDIVNRAITLYEFIEAQLYADQDILIRDRNTQEVQSVMLL